MNDVHDCRSTALPLLLVTAAGCAAPAEPAASGQPPIVRLPFEASGTEPGWHLELTAEQVTLAAAYGEIRVTGRTPAPVQRGDAEIYRLETDGHTLDITVRDRYCTNAMSGMPHPRSVEIVLDDDRFDGCGGAPTDLLQGAWSVRQLDGRGLTAAPQLTFRSDGTLRLEAGCGVLPGRYALTGEGVSLTLPELPDGCAGNGVPGLDALRSVRRFQLDAAGRLILETGSRRLTAVRP